MIVILLLTTVLLLMLLNWLCLIKNKNRMNIPGPLPLPLLGNVNMFVANDTSEYFNILNELRLQYGDVFLVHMFSTPYVTMSHPKYMEPILSSSELIIKGKSYKYLDRWLGQGLLTSTGQLWKTHRKLLTPAFHFNILQVFLPVFCKNIEVLIDILKRTPKGNEINIFPVVALAALDIVTESVMGVCVNTQKNNDSEYAKAIDVITGVVSLRMQYPYLGEDLIYDRLPLKIKHDNAVKVLHAHTDRVIDARRQELAKAKITAFDKSNDVGIKNRYAFLDLLLLSETNGKRIAPERVSDEVNTFMFEGHDTTSAAISWTLFALSRHRDIQEKVYTELKDIFNDDLHRYPTHHELNQMKFLELVIKESMRLYPPVPMIERLIQKDCVVGDLNLIRGTSVLINIFQMHRHPELYVDPLEFKPERFENQSNNAFNWLAFSAGPRNCIGQKFAMMAVKVAISAIVKNFTILPSETEPKLCAELILKSKNGINLKLHERSELL